MGRIGLTIAGGVAGGVIGGFLGNPLLGAQIGLTAGGIAGSLAFPEQLPDVVGPRLNDLQVQSSAEGVPIPVIYGTVRLAGNVMWALPITEVETTEEVSAKGGASQSTTGYSYFGNFAVGLAAGPIGGIIRLWADTKLIYDATNGNTGGMYRYGSVHVETTGATNLSDSVLGAMSGLSALRLYLGDETQEPDPLIEADQGAGQVPPWRGLVYVVFENLPLADFGNRLPNISAEIAADATESTVRTDFLSGSSQTIRLDQERGLVYMQTTSNRIYKWDIIGKTLITTLKIDTSTYYGSAVSAFSIDAEGYLYRDSEFGAYPGRVIKIHPDTGAILAATVSISSGIRLIRARHVRAGGSGGTAQSEKESRVWALNYFTNKLYAFQSTRNTIGEETLTQEFEIILDASSYYANCLTLDDNLDPWLLCSDGTLLKVEIIGTSYSISSWDLSSYVYPDYLDLGGGVGGLLLYDSITAHLVYFYSDTVSRYALRWDTVTETVTLENDLTSTVPWISNGTYQNFESNEQTGITGRSIWVGKLQEVNVETLEVVFDGSSAPPYSITACLSYDSLNQGVWAYTTTTVDKLSLYQFNRLTPVDATLDEVVGDLCDRAGLAGAEYDVTDLASDMVRGYALTRRGPVRGFIEPLQRAYFFDGIENDGALEFTKRGGSSVLTLTSDDLIPQGSEGNQSSLDSIRHQDVDLPVQVDVRYSDVDRDYQDGTQSARRISL